MNYESTRIAFAALGLGVLLLVGCASAPKLISKTAMVPADVDLSGRWRARSTPGADQLPGQQARAEPIIRHSRSSRRRFQKQTGSPVEVFLEFGELLKISQTEYGLFISYDRSVVEEYTFGENREVSVGPIEAQRVSGWVGVVFVVETLDASGSRLIESWHLQENESSLQRTIVIRKGDKKLFSMQQSFDRL